MKKLTIANVLLSSLLAASLAGAPVLAAETAGQPKLTFPDIQSNYWGLKHISKLALEGIIQGYEDGSYRAENSVSQQEVLVMAIRMMGLEDAAQSMTATTVFPDFLMVDDYARNYVALAREKGLISYEEEKARAQNDTSKTKWGQRKATREWVAEIVIRAIGQQSLANTLGSQPTSFTDNNTISYSALGYVNAAVSLNVVNGFEDGTFQPMGFVTRAQMAAFLSRSQNNLAALPQHAVRGYLTGMTSSSISIMDKDGNASTYSLSPKAVFYGNKNDNPITPAAIQETYEVQIVQVDNTAYYVEVLDDTLQMDVYEGSVVKVNLSDMTVTLYRNDDYEKHVITPDVTITDKDGRGLSLSSIVPNSIVELRRSKLAQSEAITSIVVKQMPVNKSSEGIIQSINKDTNQMTLLETATSQSETFPISGQIVTTLADNSLVEFSSLHVGDTVAYDIVNSEVNKIVVKKQADVGLTVNGTLTGVSADKSYMTISKAGGTALASYFLNDNAQVAIEGLANASIYDLENGDEVTLEILNNKVNKITVTSRSIVNSYLSKIISYDPVTKYLTVQDTYGKPQAYELSDTGTTIMYMGSKVPFNNFASLFTVGKRVDMKVTKDKVLSIELSSELQGVITQLNLQTSDLTVKTDSGQSLTFKLSFTPVVEVANKPKSTITDLKIGDKVTALLNYDQSSIIKIVTSSTVVYKTLLVSPNTKSITVSDSANVNYSFSLDGVTLLNDSLATAGISDILPDDYIKLSFKGYTILNAQIVTPLRGKVTAIDTASSSLTVQGFNGSVQVVGLGASYSIKQNGGAALTLASIKVGDRVQVMKDENGRLAVQVASASQRVVASYNNSLNQLILQPGVSGDRVSYNLFPRAYYHQGTQPLTIASFAANDSVMIYVLDDKIVEIEKK
ncbi:S-layer homology domain-containing protein [Paenibacillus athensensis]|uniref:SLH domain-containing protein n=1 Tax=Paenibacillus athensensis TaxID=1967502 RepID=A0A4Y8Q940_9BACL|nr:S-layer homology domain-containing protein [Paenibacillus athensensis]MCD1260298.1 S-layer homology domain-containing protein [Paenibacillus athensensis]